MTKFLSRLKLLFFNTWVLALILAIPIFILLPVEIQKFITEVRKTPKPEHVSIKYRDLDNDGKPEFIDYYNNGGKLSFSIHDYKGGLIDQWNFPGEYYIGSTEIFIKDIDQNGLKEIIGLTKKHDSVFCNYVEPLSKNNKMHSFYVDRISSRKDYPPDYNTSVAGCIDMNGDSLPELVVIINAGYSLEPRKIYSYDFQNNKLLSSPRSGMVIHNPVFEDFENLKPLIFGTAKNGLNIPEGYDIPFSDSSVWLMIYDNHLNYIFTPIGFKHTYAYLKTELCEISRKKYFISFYSPSRDSDGPPVIMINDLSGRIIRTDTLKYLSASETNTFIKKDDHTFYIITKNGVISEINPDLKILRSTIVPSLLSDDNNLIDLNQDGQPELIIKDFLSREIFILSGDLRNLNEITMDKDEEYISNVSYVNKSLFFHTRLNEYFVTYHKNIYYYAQIPLFTGIYLIIVSIVYFIKKTLEFRIREKYEFMSQVRSLEMHAFRSQMDPHFTLNLFNIISSLLKKEKTEDALNAFIRFSKLIRLNLEHSEDLTRPLSEEMEAVESFLQISKLRFGDKIEYSLMTEDENLNNILIPKMIILTHVENAVKHGIKPKDGKGQIIVSIKKENDILHIIIEDDGIGRKKASEIKTRGSGLGLELLDKLIEHLNKNNREKITQQIIDLTDSAGAATGTRILIKLPVSLI